VQSNAVDAAGRQRADDEPAPDLILFVKEGRLWTIENVFNGNDFTSEFPAPAEFESPVALWFSSGSS
jgi:hypothetical protein